MAAGGQGFFKNVALEYFNNRQGEKDHQLNIINSFKKCMKEKAFPILQSTAGVEIDSGIPEQFLNTDKYFRGIMVANCVEGILERDWLQRMMDARVMVIGSGARFYRGPQLSGVVFVPPDLMYELQQASNLETQKLFESVNANELFLSDIFSKYDFPT